MIIYKGISRKNKNFFLSFINDKQETVSVPIDQVTARRIASYISQISPPLVPDPERELSDDESELQ